MPRVKNGVPEHAEELLKVVGKADRHAREAEGAVHSDMYRGI